MEWEGVEMNEKARNLRVAEVVRRDHRWAGQEFNDGDYIALLNGNVIAVAKDPDEAISALRAAEPDPRRGMVIEVHPPKVDVVR